MMQQADRSAGCLSEVADQANNTVLLLSSAGGRFRTDPPRSDQGKTTEIIYTTKFTACDFQRCTVWVVLTVH